MKKATKYLPFLAIVAATCVASVLAGQTGPPARGGGGSER